MQDDLISSTASPPCYLKADLHQFPVSSLNCEFDVILVEPPLEEYQHTAPGHTTQLQAFWDWEQIRELDIAQVGRREHIRELDIAQVGRREQIRELDIAQVGRREQIRELDIAQVDRS